MVLACDQEHEGLLLADSQALNLLNSFPQLLLCLRGI